jgi:hypothetical protein
VADFGVSFTDAEMNTEANKTAEQHKADTEAQMMVRDTLHITRYKGQRTQLTVLLPLFSLL